MTFDSDYEPWFEPPGWIIGPIWLVLYTMLAISFTMMLAKREAIPNSNLVIGLFVIQMIANLMWPNVFNSAEYLASFLLIVVMALLLMGGEVIHNFAFALTVGIFIGTYSSIFVASPVMVYLETRHNQKLAEN